MLGFLYRMLIGTFKSCDHKYEIIETVSLVHHRNGLPYGRRIISRCNNCGKLHLDKFDH